LVKDAADSERVPANLRPALADEAYRELFTIYLRATEINERLLETGGALLL
jgi:hypothetical protein